MHLNSRLARSLASCTLLALILAQVACSRGNTGAAAGGAGGRGGRGGTVTVKTTTPQRITVQRKVELAGNLLSPDEAKVSSEAAGVVREVLVEIGTEVKAGQPLVRLEPKELQLALARAESSLKQSYAQLGMHGEVTAATALPSDENVAALKTAIANRDDAAASYRRAQVLSGRGLLSPMDLQTAETRMKVAEANYQAALDSVRSLKAQLLDRRAAYDLAQKKLNDTVVKAPIAGAVAERYVQGGEFIAERTLVARIVQVNPLRLRTGVQERYAGTIASGQPVEFTVASFGDTVFKGKVAYVGPSVDQTMRSFTVEAIVENDDRRLKPGFFAKGNILTKADPNVLAVPDSTVSTMAGVSSVYVVADGKIKQTTVTLGPRLGNVWEVVDGLTGNEVLAASNLNQLATGVRVKLQGTGDGDGATSGDGAGRGEGRTGQGPGRGAGGEGGRGRGQRGGQQ